MIPAWKGESRLPRRPGVCTNAHAVDVSNGCSQGTATADQKCVWSCSRSDAPEGEVHRLGSRHAHVVLAISL